MSNLIQKPTDKRTKSDDGAGGSLWTNVAGFIERIRSSAGATFMGVKRAIANAAELTVAGWVESQTYCTSDFADIVSDGTGDNRAALENIIALLPEGSGLRIRGLLRIASTWTITKRINIICPNPDDAILVDVGTLNDGIVFSGPASGLNNIELKLNVYGRANACKDALILSRVDRSPNLDINVFAGAVGYGIKMKGMLINKIQIQSSVNYLPPITNPGFQAKHIKVEKVLGVAFNLNDVYVNLEGGGTGIESDDMLSEGNNKIHGAIEGLTSGRPLDLVGWMGASISDVHFEANAMGPRFFNCSHLTVGPNVLNPNAATPMIFENCRQPKIDGYFGGYEFDENCAFPIVGRVLASSEKSHSMRSYFASSEVQGSSAWLSSSDVFYGGVGSFTLENLFHNPFVDVWTNGYGAAPDGFTVSGGSAQLFTYPAPTYTAPEGKSCEVNITTAGVNSGITAACAEPYNKGQQQGHFMAAMVAIYVAAGQPDVNVFVRSGGQYHSIGSVTDKGQWIEIRGGARCSANQMVDIHIVPWNFGSGVPLAGKFVIGGLSIVQGVRAPRHICNHGKREGAYATTITNPPSFIGQRALVAGKWYMAGGTAAPADWLMLN